MMKKSHILSLFCFVLFTIISLFFIQVPVENKKEQFHSSSLEEKIEKKDNQERVTYINSNGAITFAADKGYAIKTITDIHGRKIEQYYDENKKPIIQNNQYYAILREYDEQGRNIKVTYLGIDGEPTNIIYGYAIVEYDFNKLGKIEEECFYDKNGIRVCSHLYGYGIKNEYDDKGNIKKITYIDEVGNPIKTGLGYAVITRTYYNDEINNNRVKDEFYFDEKGNPISLSLGQYGLHKEYNELGQNILLTFLDKEGKPTITTKGYTTIIRTFNNDNSIASEMYYDKERKPYRLSEGQYGRSISKGQEKLLNINGREQINLKRLVYNQSEYSILFALIISIVASLLSRKIDIIIFILYIIVILYMTIFFRESSDSGRTEILWYYRNLLSNSSALSDVLKNIWLFFPLGVILFQIYPKRYVLLVPIVLSIFIEGIQYFAAKGYCELDDIISNTIGGCIGFQFGKLTNDLLKRIKLRRHIHIV